MTHAIIFANRGSYGFYERSEGFPERYLDDIKQVSDSATWDGGGNLAAVRYAPLDRLYLLSVIIRQPGGNKDEPRAHVISVHFLMDRADADRFFDTDSRGFQGAYCQAKATAQELLKTRDQALSREQIDLLFQPNHQEPGLGDVKPVYLLAGALGSGQSLMESDNEASAVHSLAQLLSALPPQLRRSVSFHTWACSGKEAAGVSVSMCSRETLGSIIARKFSGMREGDKFYYYKDPADSRMDAERMKKSAGLLKVLEDPAFCKYKTAIHSWNELERMAGLDKLADAGSKLTHILRNLEEQDRLTPMVPQMNREEAGALLRSAPRKSHLHEAARQRAEELKVRKQSGQEPAEAAAPKEVGPDRPGWQRRVMKPIAILVAKPTSILNLAALLGTPAAAGWLIYGDLIPGILKSLLDQGSSVGDVHTMVNNFLFGAAGVLLHAFAGNLVEDIAQGKKLVEANSEKNP